jgi:hypothetical protein
MGRLYAVSGKESPCEVRWRRCTVEEREEDRIGHGGVAREFVWIDDVVREAQRVRKLEHRHAPTGSRLVRRELVDCVAAYSPVGSVYEHANVARSRRTFVRGTPNSRAQS